MDQYLIFLALGLANGAVYGALALTLVVTYRSSGVVNFATGAMALLGAYMYAFLRQGQILLPLPFLPETINLPDNLGFWPAAIIAVAICAVVGLLVYLAIFRPMRNAPPVAKAVASIGLMVVFTGVFVQKVGTTAVSGAADPAHQRLDGRRGAHLPGPGVVRGDRRRHHPRAGGGVPVHPLRAADPGRGRDREGRVRQRHLARSHRRRQLDDQRRGGGAGRHPHRPDRAGHADRLHAVHRPGPGRGHLRPVQLHGPGGVRRVGDRHDPVRAVLPEGAADLAARLRPERAGSARADPARAGGAGQAVAEPRRHHPADARPGPAAPVDHAAHGDGHRAGHRRTRSCCKGPGGPRSSPA